MPKPASVSKLIQRASTLNLNAAAPGTSQVVKWLCEALLEEQRKRIEAEKARAPRNPIAAEQWATQMDGYDMVTWESEAIAREVASSLPVRIYKRVWTAGHWEEQS